MEQDEWQRRLVTAILQPDSRQIVDEVADLACLTLLNFFQRHDADRCQRIDGTFFRLRRRNSDFIKRLVR